MKRTTGWAAVVGVVTAALSLGLWALAERSDDKVSDAIAARLKVVHKETCEIGVASNCQGLKDLRVALLNELRYYDLEDAIDFAPNDLYGEMRDDAPRLLKILVDRAGGNAELAMDRFFDGPEVLEDPVSREVDIPALLRLKEVHDPRHEALETAALVIAVPAAIATFALIALGLWAIWLAMIRSTRKAWTNPNG